MQNCFVFYGKCLYEDKINPLRRIWKNDTGVYTNTIHADIRGELSIEDSSNMNKASLHQIRCFISRKLHRSMPLSTKIILLPCHPKQVKDFYGPKLKENNIEIIGDWEDITYSTTAVKLKEVLIVTHGKAEIKSVTINLMYQIDSIEKEIRNDHNRGSHK